MSSQISTLEMRTKLTAFYDLCLNDVDARRLKYVDVNSYYSWQAKEKKWKLRSSKKIKAKLLSIDDEADNDETAASRDCTLGRLQTVSATDIER